MATTPVIFPHPEVKKNSSVLYQREPEQSTTHSSIKSSPLCKHLSSSKKRLRSPSQKQPTLLDPQRPRSITKCLRTTKFYQRHQSSSLTRRRRRPSPKTEKLAPRSTTTTIRFPTQYGKVLAHAQRQRHHSNIFPLLDTSKTSALPLSRDDPAKVHHNQCTPKTKHLWYYEHTITTEFDNLRTPREHRSHPKWPYSDKPRLPYTPSSPHQNQRDTPDPAKAHHKQCTPKTRHPRRHPNSTAREQSSVHPLSPKIREIPFDPVKVHHQQNTQGETPTTNPRRRPNSITYEHQGNTAHILSSPDGPAPPDQDAPPPKPEKYSQILPRPTANSAPHRHGIHDDIQTPIISHPHPPQTALLR